MSAPSGLGTVCDLNVEGSAGCAAAAYANTTMPSAAVMRSRLIMVSTDLNRSGPQQKSFCERATGCANTVSLRGVAHIVSLGLLNSITIQLSTAQPTKLILGQHAGLSQGTIGNPLGCRSENSTGWPGKSDEISGPWVRGRLGMQIECNRCGGRASVSGVAPPSRFESSAEHAFARRRRPDHTGLGNRRRRSFMPCAWREGA